METVIAAPELVDTLRQGLPAITREWLMTCYGISETTWTKLRDGKPVKRTTLERIVARLETPHRARAA